MKLLPAFAFALTLFSVQGFAQTTTTIRHHNGIDPERRDGVESCISFPFAACSFSETTPSLAVNRRANGSSSESILEFWLSDDPLAGAPDVAALPAGTDEISSATLVLQVRSGGLDPFAQYGRVVYLNDLRTPTGNPTEYRQEPISQGGFPVDMVGLEGVGSVVSYDVTSAAQAALAAGDQWLALALLRPDGVREVEFESEEFATAQSAPTLIVVTQVQAPDTDGDGVPDDGDNCVLAANTDQVDSNGDGFGNACDADLDDDCIVNVVDLGILRTVFFSTDDDADFNGDDIVNVVDLGIMRSLFFDAPGPTGLPNACDES